ncbi:hypothetical protein ACLOJK_038690 [Asimina triloba]
MIFSDDLEFIHSRYHILDSIKLFAPREGKTLRDHQDGCICLNEWMFKVGIWIPFEFSVSELYHVFDATPIQVAQSVMWFCEWRKCSASRYLWVSLMSRKGIPLRCSEGLPEVTSVVPEELKTGQRLILEFFQLHNLKWCPSKEAFFQWCQGPSFFGAPVVFAREEEEERQLGEASGSSVDAKSLTRGSWVFAPYRPDPRACNEDLSRKKKCLMKGRGCLRPVSSSFLLFPRGIFDVCSFFFRGTVSKIGGGQPLGRVDSLPSLEATVEPVHPGSSSLSIPVMDLDEGALSPTSSSEKGPSRTPARVTREYAEARVVVGVSVRREVLGATISETSSSSVDGQLFRCPFDVEARALKIIGDLLPMQYKSLRESYTLGMMVPLDKEGRRSAELMLLEFLLDAICLIDGCSSRAGVPLPHVKGVCLPILGASLSLGSILDKSYYERRGTPEDCRCRKAPNDSFLTAWEHLKESLAGIVSKAHRMAGEELRPMGSDASSFNFLRWAGLTEELGVATLELGRAKEAEVELFVELDATWAKRDETRDDTEGRRSLQEATTKATGLCLQKLDVDTSIR